MRIKFFLFSFFVFSFFKTFSQSSYRFGTLPSININTDLKKGWGFNFKSEFRYSFKEGIKDLEPSLENEYLLTDISFLTSKSVGLGNQIVFGFLARLEKDKLIQRYIQQFILVKKYDGYRMSHRFATDQTLDDVTEIRLRYRITTEIPLDGKLVDAKEFYLKLNQEVLHNFAPKTYDLEFRIVPFLGYKFKDNNKIEVGLDYRLDSFLKGFAQHSSWISVNWYLKI